MKNYIFTFLLFIISITLLNAQAYEGKIEYLKKVEPAMVIDFPYPSSEVEDAIVSRMEQLGHKKKESKGFLVYKNIIIREINPQPMDYIIRVERKSRKERDEATVYFIMNNLVENALVETSASDIGSNAKSFLNSLSPYVEEHHLEVQIKDQEQEIASSEKKLRNLQSEEMDMERRMKKLEADIKDNKKDQEDKVKEISKQREILEALKKRRKG